MYYAVRKGLRTGIYNTWEETQKYVVGFQGAIYKKFRKEIDALNFMDGKENDDEISHSTNDLVVFTDGSSIGNGSKNSIAHYAVVWPFHSNYNERHDLPTGYTNNQAEYLACIKALEQACDIDPSNTRDLYIYTDSNLLVNSMTKWIEKWKQNNWRNGEIKNKDLLIRLDNLCSVRKVHWTHVRAHTNGKDWKSYWNDKVDKFAQSGIEP